MSMRSQAISHDSIASSFPLAFSDGPLSLQIHGFLSVQLITRFWFSLSSVITIDAIAVPLVPTGVPWSATLGFHLPASRTFLRQAHSVVSPASPRRSVTLG